MGRVSRLFLLSLLHASRAATTTVTDFDLKSAVENAPAGEQLILIDGTYSLSEPLVIDKALTIRAHNIGSSDQRHVVIDASAISSSDFGAIDLQSTSIHLIGLLVTGSGTTGNSFVKQGGVVFRSDSEVTVDDCNIADNHCSGYYCGGGFFAHPRSVVIFNRCVIKANTCQGSYGFGGGGHVQGVVEMNDCDIESNIARGDRGYGGGLYVSKSAHSELSMTDCRIFKNEAKNGYGGGIQVSGSQGVTLTRCDVRDNVNLNGDGGGIGQYASDITLISCNVHDNRGSRGGGFYQHSNKMSLINTRVYSNAATANTGNDVYLNSEYCLHGTSDMGASFLGAGASEGVCDVPPTSAPTTSAPTTAAPTDISSNGDPHLQLADGGSADFRGSHNGIYNMLTSDGISVNALFREQDFFQSAAGIEFVQPGSTQGGKFLVHGTFIFEMYMTVRTSSGRLLHLRTEASPTSAANVVLMENNVPVSMMGEHAERTIDNIQITTQDGVATIETLEWVVLCKFVRTDTSYFLNLSFKSLTNSAPHGIIGQSYDHDGIAVDGAKDAYNSVPGGETTTTAQAEGAIEGAHSDYLMDSPFATAYKYSRFNNGVAAVRDIRKLAGTKKKIVDGERRKLASLLQRMTGKENVVGAE